ncbi:MAG: aspartate/glutamate racemase family protein, partial [Chroococcidiopsidaceae cyanobacterium CP_BM_RX_35]|nr:aspartate/glutamate racemase family protein [Chroococcidiopsidaceae cyanobacterium CP_BM_RX_35]
AMLEIDPTVRVWQVSCPELVPLIEQNRINDPYTSKVTKYYLSSLLQQQIDTLVFGCTHYPHIEPIVRSLLPASVRLVDPAIHVVESAVKELDMLGLASPHTLRETRFCVSGSPQKFAHSCIQWIGYMPEVESVSWLEARSPVVRLESLD